MRPRFKRFTSTAIRTGQACDEANLILSEIFSNISKALDVKLKNKI
jgi:hypothetical protein